MVFIGRAGIGAVLGSLIQTELIFLVAWLLGDASRIRGLYAGTLEERAQRLERERDEQTERAVRDERERIARELHDVVTHHVSVIVIQAGGALQVIDKRPDEARTALTGDRVHRPAGPDRHAPHAGDPGRAGGLGSDARARSPR